MINGPTCDPGHPGIPGPLGPKVEKIMTKKERLMACYRIVCSPGYKGLFIEGKSYSPGDIVKVLEKDFKNFSKDSTSWRRILENIYFNISDTVISNIKKAGEKAKEIKN